MGINGFDYSLLDGATRDAVQHYSAEIQAIRGNKSSEIVELGKKLI